MPTRRTLLILGLGLAGAASLAACGDGTSEPGSATEPEPSTTTPADVVSREVGMAEQTLITRYAEVIASFPGLAVYLEPIKAQHAEPLAAMQVEVPAPPPEPGQPSEKAAISMLRKAELRASIDRQASCVTSADSGLARILAFIAASEASHVAVLKAVGDTP
ncbi:MAG: hypothetical protein WCO31_04080 [Actinomycetes bacterium]